MPAPRSIALLRLSAIGDCCHILPVIHSLRQNFDCPLSWIIGSVEYPLFAPLSDIVPDLNFIVYDKKQGLSPSFRQQLKAHKFDVLLHMQTAARASLIAYHINAARKIGFAWQQSKEGQYWFCNEHISAQPRQHFVETFLGFAEHLGAKRPQKLSWELPQVAQFSWHCDFVVIHPCSSSELKNWQLDGWREVCAYILANSHLDILITGANSKSEQHIGSELARLNPRCHNMVGKSSLAELYAIIKAAKCIVSPDTGALHIATIAARPAIGLFAVTNMHQTGPYHSLDACIDCYPQALQQILHSSIKRAPFGKKINSTLAMQLIAPPEVIGKLQRFL